MKRGREYHGCWEEYRVNRKGRGKQFHISHYIEALGKNIKRGKGEGHGNFGEENQDLKIMWVGKNVKL